MLAIPATRLSRWWSVKISCCNHVLHYCDTVRRRCIKMNSIKVRQKKTAILLPLQKGKKKESSLHAWCERPQSFQANSTSQTRRPSTFLFLWLTQTARTILQKADLSINPHTWCLSTLKHFQLISSNVKTFCFFCTQRSSPFIFCIQFKAAFHENCVIVLIKNILNYCRSSLNLKSTLCIHSNYLNCLLWGVIDMQRGEKTQL